MTDANVVPGLEPGRVELVRDRLAGREWHEVTVAELAEAAGVSRMTLHRRGIGKDDVLRQLGELLLQDHRDAMYPALVAPGDGRVRLRLALEGLCAVNERYLGVLDALGEQAYEVFHDTGDGAVLTREPFTAGLRRILEDGGADGTLRGGSDLDDEATLLFNAAGWTYRHMRTGHRWAPERARAAVVDLLLHGSLLPSTGQPSDDATGSTS
ncbi:MAG: TetR/AcrR family transcriptional regulator [Patulibacter sp.]